MHTCTYDYSKRQCGRPAVQSVELTSDVGPPPGWPPHKWTEHECEWHTGSYKSIFRYSTATVRAHN